MSDVKILLAEDEEVMRSMLVDFMDMLEYKVKQAENGKIAWDLWQRDKYDLVISDINMPEMSGIDLLRNIKVKNRDFPVVLITGVSIDSARKMAKEYKADAFLSKPFKMKDLMTVLQQILSTE